MPDHQQKQALNYFSRSAGAWAKKAKSSGEDEVNVIRQRNDYVLKVMGERKNVRSFLDIGCGTGDLVCEAARRGVNATGIDFAKEMIEAALRNAKRLNIKKAGFVCSSIFDFEFERGKYDVISANGLIEYISLKGLGKLLSLSSMGLKRGGSLILGSRNRLYNIFSLNRFTQEEIESRNMGRLISEAAKIANARHVSELIGLKTARLQTKVKKQLNTGIDVSVRYQYTPAQLINILLDKGFEPVQIYPIHIHGVTPKFKDMHPSVHAAISNLLQDYAEGNMSLIPASSSFMIHAKKR